MEKLTERLLLTGHIPPGLGRGEFADRMLPERCVFLLDRDKWIEHTHVF